MHDQNGSRTSSQGVRLSTSPNILTVQGQTPSEGIVPARKAAKTVPSGVSSRESLVVTFPKCHYEENFPRSFWMRQLAENLTFLRFSDKISHRQVGIIWGSIFTCWHQPKLNNLPCTSGCATNGMPLRTLASVLRRFEAGDVGNTVHASGSWDAAFAIRLPISKLLSNLLPPVVESKY